MLKEERTISDFGANPEKDKSGGSEENLASLQNELLELLKRFHTFCTEQDIPYSVHGGTMIGIIREHGFIPWDDDADVSFTRENFRRFQTLMEQTDPNILFHASKDERFFFSLYDNAFPQLWMTRRGRPGVWLDIFIYDFITENRFLQKLKFMRIALMLGLQKNRQTMESTRRRGLYSGLKYIPVYGLYLIGHLFSEKRKYKMAERVHQSFPGRKQKIHRSNDRYIGIGFVYPREVMEKYLVLPFEDTSLMVTARYEDILIPSYGDYMTPVRDNTSLTDVHTLAREFVQIPPDDKDTAG